MPLLEVEGLRAGYGPDSAATLDGVSLVVEEGETDALIGGNGAGKSTTLLCIAGLVKPRAGSIRFDGEIVTGMDTDALVVRGLALMPEGRHALPELTVDHNLHLGGWSKRRDRATITRSREFVFDLFPTLAGRAGERAGTLSRDDQQMLALGRALMASPRLLLVDEVSRGLTPQVAQDLFRLTRRINAEGVTLLMAEQNAGLLRRADRAFVMEKGRVRWAGPAGEVAEQSGLRAGSWGELFAG